MTGEAALDAAAYLAQGLALGEASLDVGLSAWIAALDVHPRVAMGILRHAQIDVTMNVYTEVSAAKTLQALRRLARQLDT